MPHDPEYPNSISPTAESHTGVRGDLPEALKLRYHAEDRGGLGLDHFAHTNPVTPVFRDIGRELVTANSGRDAARDIAAIARHRGWSSIIALGSDTFRREVFVAGMAIGLTVFGHRATARDLKEVEPRGDEAARRKLELQNMETGVFYEVGRRGASADTWMKTAEAVVTARLTNPEDRAHVLARMAWRLAHHEKMGWELPTQSNRDAPRRDRGQAR